MTDEMRPCVHKAMIDLHDTWAIDSEQGEHIAECLNDAYNAGANDARTWRPLTPDPASWPERGQLVAVYDSRQTKWGSAVFRWPADVETNWSAFYDHWHDLGPLPPPPKGESK